MLREPSGSKTSLPSGGAATWHGSELPPLLSTGRSGDHHMLFVLEQIVGDREPPRLRADKDVPCWADGRIVDESSHGHVDERAVANDGIEESAAHVTARVAAILVAKDHEVVLTLGDAKLVALDAGERLEGRTSRSSAVRAMTVRGVEEFVRHGILDGAAQALPGKRAVVCFL